jgi:restriction endonuclease S subunit
MKLKATKSQIKNNYYYILRASYCSMQYLLNYENAFGYSARVEGWACDYYDIKGICISTGYAPLQSQNMIENYELIREYEHKAQAIQCDNLINWETQRTMTHDILVELLEQLKDLA